MNKLIIITSDNDAALEYIDKYHYTKKEVQVVNVFKQIQGAKDCKYVLVGRRPKDFWKFESYIQEHNLVKV